MAFHLFTSDLPIEVRRVLIIIFIILTIVSNLCYLLRCRRVSTILDKPVFCCRISSCIGCIALTLFSYVIMARIFFFDTDDLTCTSIITSMLYFTCFLPFVFGTSLFLQGVSILMDNPSAEQGTMSSIGPKVRSISMAVLPWLLGFVLVCPLTMGDTEWDDVCFALPWSRQRARAIEIICIIIPAAASLLCSVAVYIKSKHDSSFKGEDSTTAIRDHFTPTAPPITDNVDQASFMLASQASYPMHTYTEKYPQQHQDQYPQQSLPPYPPQCSQQDMPPPYSELYPQQYPQEDSQGRQYEQPHLHHQVHSQQYLQLYSQHYPQQYPSSPMGSPNPAPPLFTPTTLANPPPTTSADESVNTKNVVSTYLLSIVIFVISLIPASAFTLGYHLNHDPIIEMEEEAETKLSEAFYWLMYLYPLVIPFIWRRDIKA